MLYPQDLPSTKVDELLPLPEAIQDDLQTAKRIMTAALLILEQVPEPKDRVRLYTSKNVIIDYDPMLKNLIEVRWGIAIPADLDEAEHVAEMFTTRIYAQIYWDNWPLYTPDVEHQNVWAQLRAYNRE